jgi:GNAT superfamily N-acetyltransferase
MAERISIRVMEPGDSPALLALEDKTVDTGHIGFSTSYNYDYYQTQQALRPGLIGIVAEAPEYVGLVGVGLMSFGECQIEGDVLPYGYIGGLGIHPDFRRRGISTAITSELLAIFRKRFGTQAVLFAGIQGGNKGSLKANMKWAKQIIPDRVRGVIDKTLQEPPEEITGITIRPVAAEELESAVALQNAFYRNANLYPPKTAADISAWLSKRPFDQATNRYYVAVDSSGKLLAGLGVTLLGHLTVTHMPPKDEGNKMMGRHWFWFQDGHETAGRQLLETVKWLEHENANTTMLFFDGQGPVGQVFSTPIAPPQASGYIVVNAPVELNGDRFLYFNNLPV